MSGDHADAAERAVAAVRAKAAAARANAEVRLSEHGIDAAGAAALAEGLRSNSRLTLNFHPDRRDSSGRTVAAGLLADGRYRPQFETGVSNGQRSAVRGGHRMRWETLLFDGAYDADPSPRPIYGALDVLGDPYGASPRFGSSFVVLSQTCLTRATLCVGDSHLGPVDLGTVEEPFAIIAGAIEECISGHRFGRDLTVQQLVDRFIEGPMPGPSARELDGYIEAQVHGGIDLDRDVSAIMIDPSFRHSNIERDVVEAANRHGFEFGWTEGSEVRPSDIVPEFRGRDMPVLARDIARVDGVVDAAAIGRALADLPFTDPSPAGDPESSPLQQYKKLWHCCLRFGRPPH